VGQQPLLSGQEEEWHLAAAVVAGFVFQIFLKAIESVSLFSAAVCCLVGPSLPPFFASPCSVVVGAQPFILGAAKVSFPCAAVNCWKGGLVLAFCYTERDGILQMIDIAEKRQALFE